MKRTADIPASGRMFPPRYSASVLRSSCLTRFLLYAFLLGTTRVTGENIRRLRLERGFSVRALQAYFGFEEPRAIYKWQKGETLPSVDNLYALGKLFDVPMDQILIPAAIKLHTSDEQQAEPCCSSFFAVLWGFADLAEADQQIAVLRRVRNFIP